MIVIVIGTRPDMIKMKPVIDELERREVQFEVMHTGQHYGVEMDLTFMKHLKVQPGFRATLMQGTCEEKYHEIYTRVRAWIDEKKDRFVRTFVVYGDTMSAMAVTTAAKTCGDRVVHVEAGLRSFDLTMPEEVARVVMDSLADRKCCPTELQRENLLREHHDDMTIDVTGNTIVDAVVETAEKVGDVEQEEKILVTLHRPENVDDPLVVEKLSMVMKEMARTAPVTWPVHPRSLAAAQSIAREAGGRLKIVDPMGHFDFVREMMSSRLVVTDSGGVQEETCILGIPCVTLRRNTERPETISCGANVLMDVRKESVWKIADVVRERIQEAKTWECPYRDGAAEIIAEVLTEEE